jgi:hypothetical protein
MKRFGGWWLCVLILQITVSGHVLDEYLQLTQIEITPDKIQIELRLIPGVEVANQVFGQIDADGTGQISSAEEQQYIQQILKDLEFKVDGRNTPLEIKTVQFPPPLEMKEGIGFIRLKLVAETALAASGDHQISFRNNHLPKLSVYQANALQPNDNAIKINHQERDPLQHELKIDFNVLSATTTYQTGWTSILAMFGICLMFVFLLLLWKNLRSLRHRG